MIAATRFPEESNYLEPNRARLRSICAVDGDHAFSLDASSEIYIAEFPIGHYKTVGTGACPGCTDGVCIALQLIELAQPAGVGDYYLTNPIARQYVTWQPGGLSAGGGCPGATPARRSTWGSVKALYH